MKPDTALIIIDFINDIVHPDGKLGGHGYPNFIEANNTKKNLAELVSKARKSGWRICHVAVGFSDNYNDHPANSPLLGAAKEYGALNKAEWGCEFIEYSTPEPEDIVISKPRVSSFYNTPLSSVLSSNDIKNVYIAGCATDLAVQSAARDAHDRDYNVTVVGDACAAANDVDHDTSLAFLTKIASVISVKDI